MISATFIVAIVERLPGMTGNGIWSFLVMGLAAAPACILWDRVARKLGDIDALIAAFLLKIVAILLPLLVVTPVGVLLGTALFGVTFLGIVSMVLSMAGRYYPGRPAKMMGRMTIAYGLAQIIAPGITAMLARGTGGYAAGLYLAAAAMIIGSLLLLYLRVLSTREA